MKRGVSLFFGYDEAGRLNTAVTRDVSPVTTHTAYYYSYDRLYGCGPSRVPQPVRQP